MSVDHYENFPVASWLCPPRLRQPIRALYRFARTADDLADEGQALPAVRLASLAAYAADLQALEEGRPTSPRWRPIFADLQQAIDNHGLPLTPLYQLLSAFVQDCENPILGTRADLLDYCSRSANPIGRLLLHLYGVNDALSLRQSDDVCTALQLINFWQDLSVDRPRGRHYLPLTEVEAVGLDLQSVAPVGEPTSPAVRALMVDLCNWARERMLNGQPLALRLSGRIGWELRLVIQGGLRILEKIEAMDHDTFCRRPCLTRLDPPILLWRAWRMSAAQ